MKAYNLKKTSVSFEEIIKEIEYSVKSNPKFFKFQVPHYTYVSDEVKMQLINEGFKVYIGSWDGIMNNSLIIEW